MYATIRLYIDDLEAKPMPDYQQMYLTMIRASEAALRELESAQAQIIAAQQACEELYFSQSEPELTLLPKKEP